MHLFEYILEIRKIYYIIKIARKRVNPAWNGKVSAYITYREDGASGGPGIKNKVRICQCLDLDS